MKKIVNFKSRKRTALRIGKSITSMLSVVLGMASIFTFVSDERSVAGAIGAGIFFGALSVMYLIFWRECCGKLHVLDNASR